jgi:hypothetical protein
LEPAEGGEAALNDPRLSLEIGKLPKITLVEADRLLLHEEPDRRRLESIRTRIGADGAIRHPLVAARDHGAASHILLDGVNRYMALRSLGCRLVPVQEVDFDDEGLTLSTWHHAVEDLEAEMIIADSPVPVSAVPFEGEFTPAGDFLPRYGDGCFCCIVAPGGRGFAVSAHGSMLSRLETIRHVVRRIGSAGTMDRVSYTNMLDLAKNYPRFSALVCYREFSKRDVLELAIAGVRFPGGVTRFGVPKRTLSFGVPLSLLQNGGSLEEKEAALQRMITDKIRERKIRIYEEPTFYFDD